MKKNIGHTDAYIRSLIGLSLLLNIIILEPGTIATVVLAALGLMMFYSALTKFCPLYVPFNICTCEGKDCLCCEAKAAE